MSTRTDLEKEAKGNSEMACYKEDGMLKNSCLKNENINTILQGFVLYLFVCLLFLLCFMYVCMYVCMYACIYLTIIPRPRMGSESIAHEAEGGMGY